MTNTSRQLVNNRQERMQHIKRPAEINQRAVVGKFSMFSFERNDSIPFVEQVYYIAISCY